MAVQAYDQPISPALKPLLLNHNHNGTNHAPQINHSTNIMNDSFAVVFIFNSFMTGNVRYAMTIPLNNTF